MPKFNFQGMLTIMFDFDLEADNEIEATHQYNGLNFSEIAYNAYLADNPHEIDEFRMTEIKEESDEDDDWSMTDGMDYPDDQDPIGDDTPDRDDYNPQGI